MLNELEIFWKCEIQEWAKIIEGFNDEVLRQILHLRSRALSKLLPSLDSATKKKLLILQIP